MVEHRFAVTPMNAKTQELNIVDLSKGERPNCTASGGFGVLRIPNIKEVMYAPIDEWECPFCKAVVYETRQCECGAKLRVNMHAEKG